MLLGARGLTAWTIGNVIAASAFLHLASWSWLEPNLRNEEAARGGDALVWTLSAFPVLMLALLANVAWLSLAALERARHNRPWPLSPLAVVAVIWASALVVNGLRLVGF